MPLSHLAKIADRIDRLLVPFFKKLPALACIAIVIEYSLRPIAHGNLSDPDDYIYLTQAIDWLKGQGWFDLIQHRMNPPEGTTIHYSHILSGFYGCLIFLLQPWLGTIDAAMTVAIFIPVIYFVLFFVALHWAAKTLMDKNWISLLDFIVMFLISILVEFKPGHLDHHGLELLLAVVILGCLLRMVLQPAEHTWPILAALVLSFALMIGLEILPVYLLCATWVGLRSIVEGGATARGGLIFGIVLFIASLFFLAVTRSAAMFFDVEVQIYSIVYVTLAGSIGLCFSGIVLADRNRRFYARSVVGIGLALATGLVFLHVFPQLKTGPYGGTDPVVLRLIVENESESWALGKLKGLGVAMILWPLAGWVMSCFFLLTEKKSSHRWIWALFVLILSASIPLSFFYQSRFQSYAETFSVIPLAYTIWHDLVHLTSLRSMPQIMRLGRLIFLLLLGPTVIVFFIHIRTHHAVPAPEMDEGADQDCSIRSIAALLNAPEHYGSRPRLVIDSFNQGAEILFLTPHKILAAPYHMNLSGNHDTLAFFTTHDPAAAKAIAQSRGAELVLFCNVQAQLMPYLPKEKDSTAQDGPNFIQQLIKGQTPDWLQPIPLPNSHLMLFEVHT